MEKETVKATLFGNFSLANGQVVLREGDISANKMLQILAYIIVNRDVPVMARRLNEEFWSENSRNPESALRTLMCRLRNRLKVLGPEDYICTLPGGYQWNPEIPIETDYEQFEKVMKDMKVASEDTSAEVFRQLYKKDRDFYNYVTDPNRMQKMFVEEKYKFKGYREGKEVLDKLQNKGYTPTDDDLQKVYRLFNYTIPAMGTARETKDVANQRGKFFAEMKKRGYGAILDTNDAIYGSFKGQNPVIAFDMTNIMLNKITDTTIYSKRASTLRTIGRRALGLNNK